MEDKLLEKINHTDLFELTSRENVVELFENVAHVKDFCSDDPEFCEQVLERNAKYYTDVTDLCYLYWHDETKSHIDGIALANINMKECEPNDLKGIKVESDSAKEFLKYRVRVVNAYQEMYKKHNIVNNAELEIFSVLEKGKGIGKKLINAWENDLKKINIYSYFLSTNELCDHSFYLHNGFVLVDKRKINTTDLFHLNRICNSDKFNSAENDCMHALVYRKDIK